MRIDITEDKHGDLPQTLEPVAYTVCGRSVVIPPGYVSDGLSVPRFLWGILSPQVDARTLHGGISHDHMYEHHVCSRRDADAFLRDDLIRHGFNVILSWLVWLGVRAFGRVFW